MAEFEGKPEAAVCGTCTFYLATDSTRGWCRKRPSLYQKYDTRTHHTNWCQYYEEDQVKDKIDNRHTDITDQDFGVDEQTPPSSDVDAVEEELTHLFNGLKGMQQQLVEQLANIALGDNTMALMEHKGMVKAVAVIIQTVEGRLKVLRDATGGKTN